MLRLPHLLRPFADAPESHRWYGKYRRLVIVHSCLGYAVLTITMRKCSLFFAAFAITSRIDSCAATGAAFSVPVSFS